MPPLRAVDAGHESGAAQLARVALALRDPLMQDCMYGVAVSTHAAAARTWWATLTRVLPEPDRAAGLRSATSQAMAGWRP
ncbi:DUF4192 family protein [Nocardia amamiensis]|uniref:DUF4192 family protein n=1 Tax=Nocardia amamiensis TaxID=404578 RepID=UPI0033C3833D